MLERRRTAAPPASWSTFTMRSNADANRAGSSIQRSKFRGRVISRPYASSYW